MENYLYRNINSLFLFMVMFLTACKEIAKNEIHLPPETQEVPSAPLNALSGFNDTIQIDARAAVFFNADTFQLERIKSNHDKSVLESMKHDCYYQMSNARLVLRNNWPQIKLVQVSATRYLEFLKDDNSKKLVDLNDRKDLCGLFLFQPDKNPELADMMNIETALEFYFNGK